MHDVQVKAYLGKPGNRNNFFISFPCKLVLHSVFPLRGLHSTLHKAVRIRLGDWIDFDYWYLLDGHCLRLLNPFTSSYGDRMVNRDFRTKLERDSGEVLEIWLQKYASVINYISTSWHWSPAVATAAYRCDYSKRVCRKGLDSFIGGCTFYSFDTAYWKFEIRSSPRLDFPVHYSFGVRSERMSNDRTWSGWRFEVNEDQPCSEIFEIVYHGPEDMVILYRDGVEYGGFKKLGNDGRDHPRCTPVVSCPPGTVCILLETKRHFPTLQQLCMWKIDRVVKKKDNHSQNVMSLPLPKLLKAKLSMKAI
jgi:hypothetical protein